LVQNSVHVVELADEAERWLRFADAHGVSVLHWREARQQPGSDGHPDCRPRFSATPD